MTDKLLEFKNLVTEFQTEGSVVRAVNQISFTLNKAETIGIVGESGCGKSTMARVMSGLLPTSQGNVLLHGENLNSDPVPVAITGDEYCVLSLRPVFPSWPCPHAHRVPSVLLATTDLLRVEIWYFHVVPGT